MEFGWSARQQAAYDDLLDRVTRSIPPPVRDRTGPAGETPADPAGAGGDGGGGDGGGADGGDGDGRQPDPYRRRDWRTLGELGLLGLSVPTEHGGGGYGAVDTALRLEALGRACTDTGLVFGASAHLLACAMPIAEYGAPATRAALLPGLCRGELIAGNAMTEEQAGSDVSRLATTGTEVPGGYLLNGEKSFVTNGPIADVYVTYATTDPRAGHLGITAFVVRRDASGVLPGAPFAKMGLDSAAAGTVRFVDCFVPAEQVLGVPGQGGMIFQRSMTWERSCLFATYLGLMERMLERAIAHVRSRRQFGRRISEFQSVANRVVDMKLRTDTARLLLYRACQEIDQGRPAELSVALAKLAVAEGALASALDTVTLFGGRGYQRDEGVETLLRDTVPATVFSGSSDVQRLLIARELGL